MQKASNYKVLLLTEFESRNGALAMRLSSDCDIEYAHSTEALLEAIRESSQPYSAVTIDCASIDTEIVELITNIRETDESGDIPIFLVVDSVEDSVLAQGYAAGATDIILRPYTPYAHMRVTNVMRLRDISRELEASNRELRAAREETEEFLQRMPGGLFRYRAFEKPGNDVIDYVSGGLVSMFGCDTEKEFRELSGNTFHGMVHPEDIDRIERDISEQISYSDLDRVTYRVIRKDGEVRWLEDWGRLVTDSQGAKWFYVVVLDITEKVLQSQSYQNQAKHDSLTKLLNRTAALESIQGMRTVRDEPCALMLIDVDDFKGINDTYGHPFGDEVLSRVGSFLNGIVRGGDVVSRFGGDEFAVFIMGLGDGDRLRHIARRISETAFCGFHEEDRFASASPSLSIGVATAEGSGISFETLYEKADEALYEAKRAGKNCCRFAKC